MVSQVTFFRRFKKRRRSGLFEKRLCFKEETRLPRSYFQSHGHHRFPYVHFAGKNRMVLMPNLKWPKTKTRQRMHWPNMVVFTHDIVFLYFITKYTLQKEVDVHKNFDSM